MEDQYSAVEQWFQNKGFEGVVEFTGAVGQRFTTVAQTEFGKENFRRAYEAEFGADIARPTRDREIRRRLTAGEHPGKNIEWKPFCDGVRNRCDGWISTAKAKKPARGFSDKSIKRAVDAIGQAMSR
jgi:hypothetical protein